MHTLCRHVIARMCAQSMQAMLQCTARASVCDFTFTNVQMQHVEAKSREFRIRRTHAHAYKRCITRRHYWKILVMVSVACFDGARFADLTSRAFRLHASLLPPVAEVARPLKMPSSASPGALPPSPPCRGAGGCPLGICCKRFQFCCAVLGCAAPAEPSLLCARGGIQSASCAALGRRSASGCIMACTMVYRIQIARTILGAARISMKATHSWTCSGRIF